MRPDIGYDIQLRYRVTKLRYRVTKLRYRSITISKNHRYRRFCLRYRYIPISKNHRYRSVQLRYRYIPISKIHRYRVRYSSSISKFCRLGYIRCRPAAALPGCCSVLDTDCSVGNSLHINWRASGSCSSARPSLSTGSCGGGRGRSGRRRPGRRRRLRLHRSRRWLRCRWHHLLINSRLTAAALA